MESLRTLKMEECFSNALKDQTFGCSDLLRDLKNACSGIWITFIILAIKVCHKNKKLGDWKGEGEMLDVKKERGMKEGGLEKFWEIFRDLYENLRKKGEISFCIRFQKISFM